MSGPADSKPIDDSYSGAMPLATAEPVMLDNNNTVQMQQFQKWQQEQQFQQFLLWQKQQQQISTQHDSQFQQFQQWQASQQMVGQAPMPTTTTSTSTTNMQTTAQTSSPANPTQNTAHEQSSSQTNASANTNQQKTQESAEPATNDTQTSSSKKTSGGGFGIFSILDNATAQMNKISSVQTTAKSKVKNVQSAFQKLTSDFRTIFGACNGDACTSVAGQFR